jgi:hypothetical protein
MFIPVRERVKTQIRQANHPQEAICYLLSASFEVKWLIPSVKISMILGAVIFGFMIAFTTIGAVTWDRWVTLSKEATRTRRVIANMGFALMIYGGNAFMIQALAATGMFMSIPSHWNLPMGYGSCVRDNQQQQFCVSTAGRVQKYSAEGRFIKGWFIEAFGGSAKIRKGAEGTIQLISSRRGMVYTFDDDGNLLSAEANIPRRLFERTKEKRRYVSTSLLLMPLTHPWLAVFTMLLGKLLAGLADRAFWRLEFQRRWNS